MLTKEQSTLLLEGARQLQIELTTECAARIAVYLEELQRWAKIVDLVSQSDSGTIIRKHILDSLATLSVLPGVPGETFLSFLSFFNLQHLERLFTFG